MIRRGRLYVVKGLDRPKIVHAISSSANRFGYRETVQESDDDLTIAAQSIAPAYLILLHALPQKFTWHLFDLPNDNTIGVRFDQHYFGWYRTLCIGGALVVGTLWTIGLAAVFSAIEHFAMLSIWTLILPVIGMMAVFLLARQVLTGGGGTSIQIQESIRAAVRGHGGDVNRADGLQIDGKLLSLGALLGFLTVSTLLGFVLGGASIGDMFRDLSAGRLILLGAATLGIIAVAAALWAMYLAVKRRGVDDRFAPVAPAMFTMLTIGSLLLSQLSFRLIGQTDGELWISAFIARDALANATGDLVYVEGASAPRARIEYGLRMMALMGGGVLLIAALLWALSLGMALKSLRTARQVLTITRRIRQDIDTDSGRAAASGDGFMVSFRRAFGTIWLCYGIGFIIGIVGLLLLIGDVFRLGEASQSGSTPVGVVVGNTNLLALLLNSDPNSLLLRTSACIGFIGWPLFMCGVVVYSSYIPIRQRRVVRAELTRWRVRSRTAQCERYKLLTHAIASRVDLAAPVVILVKGGTVHVASHIIDHVCVIEISDYVVERLSDDEIDALIAHEFAHYLCGHSLKHEILQLLGHITLVGSAFVAALENSFDYELEADRVAVTRLGASPGALRRCLLKLEVMASIQNARVLSKGRESGLGVVQDYSDTNNKYRKPHVAEWRNRLREGVRAWLFFFRSGQAAAYWHPALQDRLKQLEEMSHS